MKMIPRLFALTALLLSCSCAHVQNQGAADKTGPDKNFYIFLCFGQSNMEGFPGTIEAQDRTVDDRFQLLAAVDFAPGGRYNGPERKKDNWYPAIPPLCRQDTGLCPADYFGRTLVANLPKKIKVGVINVAVAGCKIELFDKANYGTYLATAASYQQADARLYGGSPYQRLVDMGKEAQKVGVIKGILLHQGESNSGDRQWPNKVKGIYDNLLQDLNLKAADVPLLAGELVARDQGGATASMNTIIDDLPKTIPTAHAISATGCTKANNLHFNAAGYRLLGTRYGETMLGLLGIKVKQPVDQPK